jgi:peptide deformylase
LTVRPILLHGASVLHDRCEPVTCIDQSVIQLIQDLADTLYETTGVGLAAPQIGVNKRVFIYDPYRVEDARTFKVMINPRITARTGVALSKGEGCKSTPDLRVDVQRSETVTIEGLDDKGQPLCVRAEGFEATVLQHEIDHLDGKLITDRLEHEALDSYERRLDGMIKMQNDPWYVNNIKAIRARLKPLAEVGDGLLFKQRKTHYEILVIKDGSQVQLYFADHHGDGKHGDLSGIMSRIDIDSPLNLLGVYTQVMTLSLLWKPNARSVYLLGFGGGRIPMILHHCYPDMLIDSTETDSTVVSLAKRYFGIEFDERMKVYVEDGRRYLERQAFEVKYDIILVDCYIGSGHHPFSLSTREFYELCKVHLSPGGVLVSNLVRSDPLFAEKRETFVSSFSFVRRFENETADVFFGSDIEVHGADVIRVADKLYERFNFVFPFRELAKALRPVSREGSAENAASLLLDSTDRKQLLGELRASDPIFYGVKRNDPCPCGSGKKFKHCHGRQSAAAAIKSR